MNLILCTFGKWPRCPGKITQMALVLCSSITSFPGGSVVSLVAQRIKRLPAMWETRVRSLGWEDPLEKEMATHSSTLAWRIPWTERPGRQLSMGLQRVGQDWKTLLTYLKLSCFKETGGGVISQFFCPSENTSNYRYQKISKHPF